MDTPSKPDPAERIEYFMIRICHRPGELHGINGVVERLETGEKRTFDESVELLDLIHRWPMQNRPTKE